MTILFRNAGADDWASIDQLFRTGFCDTFADLYASEDLDSFLANFTEMSWRGELTDERFAFRIVEDGGTPIGYIKVGPSELPIDSSGAAIELRQLYILKPWHGQGVADELMGWALNEARGRAAREIYLTVYTDNYRARRFYERYGFTYVGPYTFMVGQHADEDLIMKLKL